MTNLECDYHNIYKKVLIVYLLARVRVLGQGRSHPRSASL